MYKFSGCSDQIVQIQTLQFEIWTWQISDRQAKDTMFNSASMFLNIIMFNKGGMITFIKP